MDEFPSYEPVLSSRATAFLVALPKRQQTRLIALLERLAHNPFQVGDYSIPDGNQRTIEFLRIGNYVVGFWADHATKEFRIVTVEQT